MGGMTMLRDPIYASHHYPAEIISCAVWLSFRFRLRLPMVERSRPPRHRLSDGHRDVPLMISVLFAIGCALPAAAGMLIGPIGLVRITGWPGRKVRVG